MRYRYLVAGIVALAIGAGAVGASRSSPRPTPLQRVVGVTTAKPPDPPSALTRAEIQNDMKQLQLYQAQVQILNFQFEQTKAALQAKLKTLERDGWDLSLETWTYVPKGTAPTTTVGPPGK